MGNILIGLIVGAGIWSMIVWFVDRKMRYHYQKLVERNMELRVKLYKLTGKKGG